MVRECTVSPSPADLGGLGSAVSLFAAFIYLHSCRCVLSFCQINEYDEGSYKSLDLV